MAAKDAELTVGQVAEKLGGVHPETVRRYLKDDLLQGRRLPKGHRRVFASSVEELIRVMGMPEGDDKVMAFAALQERNRKERERRERAEQTFE